jgi:hypothetical protein
MSTLSVLYSFPLFVTVKGGIGTAAYHQVAGLTKLGVHVNLFCGVMPLITADENNRLLEKLSKGG